MSSLSNGKGTPWGPGLYGNPSVPNTPTYQSNPNAYQAYNTSALSQGAIAQGNQQGANQMAQAKANAAATGAGRSSAADVAQNNISGQLGQNAQNIYNQNASNSFNQQLGEMNNQNQYNLANNALQQQQYQTSAGLYQDQNKNRQQALSQFGPIGGVASLFGNYGSSS